MKNENCFRREENKEKGFMEMHKVGSKIRSGDFIHIALNTNERYFRYAFSKMEYILAYEYLEELMERLSVHSYRISVPKNIYRGEDRNFKEYINERRNIFRERPLNDMEESFIDRFRHFELEKYPEIESDQMSIWNQESIMEIIKKEKKNHILITGFDTDNEIFINALNASDMGFVPVILSDGVSAPSERNHFNALELMSRFTYMVDSRDIMLMAGDL
ncbi:MAG: isochorismatase family protein [Candidatus Thermoplasmatota archaeon]|nr:isochorismatase family protein [Candidatus Thermoplasmatota archaeon]